tara:strand:- start:140 stop:475 length:336 start_codon:yes stop_codon:yes gene_type:complete
MNGKPKRKRYFANNWKYYKAAPPEFFEDHLFEDVMEWKVAGWELPPDVCCIIRATHLQTKKVKEYVYKRPNAADKKLKQFCELKTHDLCVTTHHVQQFIGPLPKDYDEGDL